MFPFSFISLLTNLFVIPGATGRFMTTTVGNLWLSGILSIFNLFLGISTFFVSASVALLGIVTSPEFIKLSYTNPTNNPLIQIGWGLTRDLANILIVVSLVAIGLGTALKIREYEAKKSLWPLVYTAILINFSPLITGFIVDISNILMNFFLGNTIGSGGINFESMANYLTQVGQLTLDAFSSMAQGQLMTSALGKAACLFYVEIITGFVFLAYAMIFLIRHIAIWLLVILSPIAFVSKAVPLPGLRGQWNTWWKNLIEWCFIGVTCSFYLFLAQNVLKVAIEGGITNTIVETEANAAAGVGLIGTLLPYFVVVNLITIGFFNMFKTNADGAKQVVSWAQKAVQSIPQRVRDNRIVRNVSAGMKERGRDAFRATEGNFLKLSESQNTLQRITGRFGRRVFGSIATTLEEGAAQDRKGALPKNWSNLSPEAKFSEAMKAGLTPIEGIMKIIEIEKPEDLTEERQKALKQNLLSYLKSPLTAAAPPSAKTLKDVKDWLKSHFNERSPEIDIALARLSPIKTEEMEDKKNDAIKDATEVIIGRTEVLPEMRKALEDYAVSIGKSLKDASPELAKEIAKEFATKTAQEWVDQAARSGESLAEFMALKGNKDIQKEVSGLMGLYQTNAKVRENIDKEAAKNSISAGEMIERVGLQMAGVKDLNPGELAKLHKDLKKKSLAVKLSAAYVPPNFVQKMLDEDGPETAQKFVDNINNLFEGKSEAEKIALMDQLISDPKAGPMVRWLCQNEAARTLLNFAGRDYLVDVRDVQTDNVNQVIDKVSIKKILNDNPEFQVPFASARESAIRQAKIADAKRRNPKLGALINTKQSVGQLKETLSSMEEHLDLLKEYEPLLKKFYEADDALAQAKQRVSDVEKANGTIQEIQAAKNAQKQAENERKEADNQEKEFINLRAKGEQQVLGNFKRMSKTSRDVENRVLSTAEEIERMKESIEIAETYNLDSLTQLAKEAEAFEVQEIKDLEAQNLDSAKLNLYQRTRKKIPSTSQEGGGGRRRRRR